MPMRGSFCHDHALRLVVGCVARVASRYKKFVTPILSLSINFYVRIFFKVHHSPQLSNTLASCLSNVHSCTVCGSFELQPLAKLIESKNHKTKI
eukprot:UN31388